MGQHSRVRFYDGASVVAIVTAVVLMILGQPMVSLVFTTSALALTWRAQRQRAEQDPRLGRYTLGRVPTHLKLIVIGVGLLILAVAAVWGFVSSQP